jgi:RNA 2',3'-cyclic 3'-phosphodiesterase
MATIRTFIAVSISEQIRKNALRVINRLAKTTNDYKWIEPENMHITLNFLGEIDERLTPDVCRSIDQIAHQIEPFLISFAGVGAFPSNNRPRVIWMGVDQGTDELVALNRLITQEMLELRIPKDRHQFNPHLTLGRQKKGGQWSDDLIEHIEQLHDFQAGSVLTREIVVYSSFVDRFGPTYTPMSRIKLQ